MARTLNQDEYNQKRTEIIDSAVKFIYTLGYEQMSIQNIINDLQISKGAFYHYFNSKQDLLEASVQRMVDDVLKVIDPIVSDPNLAAIDKLQLYFQQASIWKAERAEYIMAIYKVWYKDENTLVREKTYQNVNKAISPSLELIVEQGIREGTFKISSAAMMGNVIYDLVFGMGDNFTRQLLEDGHIKTSADHLKAIMQVYIASLERCLGIEAGSIKIIDDNAFNEMMSVLGMNDMDKAVSNQPADQIYR
jgi:AcrR family transcriptional regulator